MAERIKAKVKVGGAAPKPKAAARGTLQKPRPKPLQPLRAHSGAGVRGGGLTTPLSTASFFRTSAEGPWGGEEVSGSAKAPRTSSHIHNAFASEKSRRPQLPRYFRWVRHVDTPYPSRR